MMEHRAKEMSGQEKRSDPVTYRNLWLRIHAADTDPAKIYGGTEIFNAVHAGKLNTPDADRLNQAAAGQRDENNRSVGQRAAMVSGIVQRAISADPSLIAQPDLVAAAQIDYNARVDDKIKEYRAAGKNPQSLFDQTNKDFVGTPQYIQSSINAAKQMKRDSLPKPVVVDSQAAYDALEPNTPYIDSSGKPGVKKGPAKKAPPAETMVPASAKSYYEENRDKYGPGATMAFDRLMDILSGKPPTRESTEEYDRRKTGL
jgi:hypothetical protein